MSTSGYIYKTLAELSEDRELVETINRMFYVQVYDHPKLKNFFKNTSIEIITQQQTDFMISLMGGNDRYVGKVPKSAHMHMFITQELFDLRNSIFKKMCLFNGVSEELAEQMTSLAKKCEESIVKKDIRECVKRYPSDEILTSGYKE